MLFQPVASRLPLPRGLALLLLIALLLPSPLWAVVEVVRPPFTIIVDEGDAALAESAADILSEALAEYAPRLPAGDAPIRVVIAESMAAFQHHAGPMAALDVNGIARSWEGLIVVKAPYLTPSQSDFRGTLRHELVHVLLFRNSDTDRMPRWLNEGISMMLANEFRWESSFSVARMFVESRLIEYRWLDQVLRAPESGMQFGDAYAQSLSMTRFLHDEIGAEAFWRVIAALPEMTFGDALRTHGGLSPQDLWQRYRGSLWSLAFWSALTPTSLLGFGGFLVIAAWFVKRRSNNRTIERWEREDFEEAFYGGNLKTWDELVEDPDAWKRRNDDSDPR